MCDFMSIVIYRDGKVGHIPENSHSGAVAALGRVENQPNRDAYFVEAEWSGKGEYQGAESVICKRGTEPNNKQIKAADRYYSALSKLLSDPAAHAEKMCFGDGVFAGDRWADVRWRVLISEKCPNRAADKLAKTKLHANGEEIKSLHPAITKLDGSFKVASGYEIDAPALTEVGGDVRVYGSAKFDALQKVGGYVLVDGSAKLDAPALTEVGGDVRVDGSAKFDAPAYKVKVVRK